MARRQKIKTPMANAHWEIKTEIQVNGRNVTPNTELSISGERGRFRFIKYVNTGEAEWIDVWGGPKKSENWRSFRLDRIKTVHYKNRTDANLAVVYKQKIKDKKAEEAEDA
jgi:hypothetical protein